MSSSSSSSDAEAPQTPTTATTATRPSSFHRPTDEEVINQHSTAADPSGAPLSSSSPSDPAVLNQHSANPQSVPVDSDDEPEDDAISMLRDHLRELDRQIRNLDDELTTKAQFLTEVREAAATKENDLLVTQERTQLARSTMTSMRAAISEADEAEKLHRQWLSLKNMLDDLVSMETSLAQKLADAEQQPKRESLHTAKNLESALGFLDGYLAPLVLKHRSVRGQAEERLSSFPHRSTPVIVTSSFSSGSALRPSANPSSSALTSSPHVASQEPVFDFLEQDDVRRERLLFELCREVDFRVTESERWSCTTHTLAEQQSAETDDAIAQKQSEWQRIQKAFLEEKAALLRIKSKVDTEKKEIDFHVHRGTLSRCSTKLTAKEEALQASASEKQTEVKGLSEKFLAQRAEKLLLEREAERMYNAVLKQREQFAKSKQVLKGKAGELKQLGDDLKKESQGWLQARRDFLEISQLVAQHRQSTSTAISS